MSPRANEHKRKEDDTRYQGVSYLLTVFSLVPTGPYQGGPHLASPAISHKLQATSRNGGIET